MKKYCVLLLLIITVLVGCGNNLQETVPVRNETVQIKEQTKEADEIAPTKEVPTETPTER